MTDNETLSNETLSNQTADNGTSWISFDFENIPSLSEVLSNMQQDASELLTSWSMVPENTYFTVVVIVVGLLAFYQLYIWFTTKSGGIFKWVLMAAILLFVLIEVLGMKI